MSFIIVFHCHRHKAKRIYRRQQYSKYHRLIQEQPLDGDWLQAYFKPTKQAEGLQTTILETISPVSTASVIGCLLWIDSDGNSAFSEKFRNSQHESLGVAKQKKEEY